MAPWTTKALRVLGFLAYAGVVVAVFTLSAYLAFSLFVRSGATPAPDLVGLSREQAQATLSDYGLGLRISEGAGRYDAGVPADHVLAQQPGPRTLVKRGSGVSVVLSLGPQRLDVPALAGRSLQAAQVSLVAGGFAVGRVLSVFSREAEPGTVVDQDPPAGETVSPATPVDLIVSLPGSSPTYLMPDLVYRHYDRVRAFFQARGFRFGSVKFESYEGVGDGVILRQFPVAGHPVAPTDPISLVVATGSLAAPPPR
jgi:serine/threonine-protein kinase